MKKDERIFERVFGRKPTEGFLDQAIFLNAYLLFFLFLGIDAWLAIAGIGNAVFLLGWSFQNFKLPVAFFWAWIFFAVFVMEKIGLVSLIF